MTPQRGVKLYGLTMSSKASHSRRERGVVVDPVPGPRSLEITLDQRLLSLKFLLKMILS